MDSNDRIEANAGMSAMGHSRTLELFIPILNFALVWPEKQKVSGTGSRNLLSCKKGEPKWGRGPAGPSDHAAVRKTVRTLARNDRP